MTNELEISHRRIFLSSFFPLALLKSVFDVVLSVCDAAAAAAALSFSIHLFNNFYFRGKSQQQHILRLVFANFFSIPLLIALGWKLLQNYLVKNDGDAERKKVLDVVVTMRQVTWPMLPLACGSTIGHSFVRFADDTQRHRKHALFACLQSIRLY